MVGEVSTVCFISSCNGACETEINCVRPFCFMQRSSCDKNMLWACGFRAHMRNVSRCFVF